MSDLISRNKVIDILEKEKSLRCGYDADIAIFSIEKVVRELPTAYDIDKVVEKLEEMKTIKGSMKTVTCRKWDYGTVNKAIEIVKQGGVSDDVCQWKQTSTAKYKTSCGYRSEEYFDTKACYCKQCGKKIKVMVDELRQ